MTLSLVDTIEGNETVKDACEAIETLLSHGIMRHDKVWHPMWLLGAMAVRQGCSALSDFHMPSTYPLPVSLDAALFCEMRI